MTKSQEIQIIREAIAKLGVNSYCGPWLADQLPSIESAITSDYPPEAYAFSIHEARIHADKIIGDARRDAFQLERDSIAQSKARFDAADKELKRKVEGFRDILRECVNSL
jgi:hypothetical protein